MILLNPPIKNSANLESDKGMIKRKVKTKELKVKALD
jgi:hypothetical protein